MPEVIIIISSEPTVLGIIASTKQTCPIESMNAFLMQINTDLLLGWT